MEKNVVYNSDCFEILSTIPDNSIDFICTDPPYGVLGNHKIETKFDKKLLAKEFYRIAKHNTFYAFFGQMPTIIEWYQAAIEAGFTYKEDITWVKRKVTSPYHKILRQKESIYIVSKGNASFHKTEGEYEDIKMPLYLDGLLNIETIKRRMSDLRVQIKTGEKRVLNKNTIHNENIYNYKNKNSELAPSHINFTNVWSFASHNTSGFNKEETNVKHPTVKPIPLLERLIELCTPEQENITVLDCFLGSGTTALACINTNRNFIGCELHNEYYEICLDRIEKEQHKKGLFV